MTTLPRKETRAAQNGLKWCLVILALTALFTACFAAGTADLYNAKLVGHLDANGKNIGTAGTITATNFVGSFSLSSASGTLPASQVGTGYAYTNLFGIPSSFSPSSHNHPISEITDLTVGLAGKLSLMDTNGAGYLPMIAEDGQLSQTLITASSVSDHLSSGSVHVPAATTAGETVAWDSFNGIWGVVGAREPDLGNPSTSGYLLSSSDAGVRSWIAPPTGGGGSEYFVASGSPAYTTSGGVDTGTAGQNATQYGYGSSATTTNSVAVGYNAASTGRAALSVGANTISSGYGSIALGVIASATGYAATAVGFTAEATGANKATAIGNGAQARGDASTAVGGATTAGGLCSLAVGDAAYAIAFASSAIGRSSVATAEYAIAIGASTEATAIGAVGLGCNASAQADDSVQVCSGVNSVATTIQYFDNRLADADGLAITSTTTNLLTATKSVTGVALAATHQLPSGGSTGHVLAKSSGSDYEVGWVAAGAGDMLKSDNLSGLANNATALSNIGAMPKVTASDSTKIATIDSSGSAVASATAIDDKISDGFLFGDGSDGDATITGNISLERDMYYNSLTINSGFTLTTDCYRIYVKGKLDNNGTIKNDGANGGNATTGTGSTANSTNPLGQTIPGGAGSGAGGDGGITTAGVQGFISATTSDGIYAQGTGGSGAAGGNGATTNGGAGKTSPNPVANFPLPRDFRCSWDFGATFTPVAGKSGAGGGGGGGDGTNQGGGGGSGGRAAGAIEIWCRELENTGGTIRANGGAGGNGAAGQGGNTGGGGGGGGGTGGAICIFAKTITDLGTIQALAGSGGTGGAGAGTGTAGGNGTAGGAGRYLVRKITDWSISAEE